MWYTRCFTCYNINKFTCAKSTLEHTHIIGILFTEYICNPTQAKDFLRPGGVAPRSFLRLFSPTCDLYLFIYLYICMSHLHFFYTRCIGEITSLSNQPLHVKWVWLRQTKWRLGNGTMFELSSKKNKANMMSKDFSRVTRR